uniref:Uncharacterized protein n=1 Tax=Octopus bimaculoides TaxID=37653 RepID=A0A0L8HGT8_OCTBM
MLFLTFFSKNYNCISKSCFFILLHLLVHPTRGTMENSTDQTFGNMWRRKIQDLPLL